MLQSGTCAGVVKPKVAAGCKDECVQEHQIGEKLGKPVELFLVTDGIDIGVLLSVEVILDPERQRKRHLRIRRGIQAGFQDVPRHGTVIVEFHFTRETAENSALCELEGASQHSHQQHDEGNVIPEDVPPWLEDVIR